MTKKLTLIFLFPVLFLIALNGFGQPNTQKISLRAPANLKIDGTDDEWPKHQLQAFNPANEIWYTICNDDENLYLTVKAPYRFAADKVLQSGMVFTVSGSSESGYKKSPDNISLTFPVLNKENKLSMTGALLTYERFETDPIAYKKQSDSLLALIDNKAISAFKIFKFTGLKSTDSLMSINNNSNLKVAGAFNRTFDLIMEIAIPLKYITGLNSKINYNIKLNGLPPTKMYNKYGQEVKSITETVFIPGSGNISSNDLYRTEPTDFWAEYILAKK